MANEIIKNFVLKVEHILMYTQIGIDIKNIKKYQEELEELETVDSKKVKAQKRIIKSALLNLIDKMICFLEYYPYGALYLKKFDSFINKNFGDRLFIKIYSKSIEDATKLLEENESLKLENRVDILKYVSNSIQDASDFCNSYEGRERKFLSYKKKFNDNLPYLNSISNSIGKSV